MKTHKITIVSCADWKAIYVDGSKKAEGHSLSPRDIFEALDIEYEEQEINNPHGVDGEVDFADDLEDIKFCPYPEEED